MDPEVVLRLSDDGESYCRLVDPASGPIHVPITEINPQGALLDTRLPFQANDYIDLTLVLKGQGSRPLFAHVVSSDKDGVRLRWLHFDPADEKKLRLLLSDFRDGKRSEPLAGPKAAGVDRLQPIKADSTGALVRKDGEPPSGGRKVVRPSSVIEPFSTEVGRGTRRVEAKPSASAADAPTANGDERVGTRRVVRPSARVESSDAGGNGDAAAKAPADGAAAKDGGGDSGAFPIGEESRANVVIESTNRFDKLPQDADARPKSDATGSVSGTRRVSVIGQDGKMDIGASIRSKAKTVRAAELAARHDRVRVLNLATIKTLIQEAVAEAIQHLGTSLGEAERKRLLEEAEESFKERLKVFQAEKVGAEAQFKILADQLKMAQTLLEQERKRTITADQFTVSEAGLGDIESAMQKVLERAIKGGGVTPEIEEQLRKLISGILDGERQRIREQELAAQNDKIALLEKKIARLAGNLEESERQKEEAQELARALEAAGGGGLRNVFTAGIKDGDANKKRKLALMKEILDINRKMREELGIKHEQTADADAPLRRAEEEDTKRRQRIAAAAAAKAETEAAEDAAEAAARTPEEPEAEAEAEAEADGQPEIDPDDMVWEVKPVVVKDEFDGSAVSSGVKRIAVKDVKPPPLERRSGT